MLNTKTYVKLNDLGDNVSAVLIKIWEIDSERYVIIIKSIYV